MRPRGLNGMFGRWTKPSDELHEERDQYAFDIGRRPVRFEDNDGFLRSMPKRDVLVNLNTRRPLAIVSHRYKPVLHKDVIERFDRRFSEQGAYFERRTAVEHGGERMIVEYRFPGIEVEVRSGDKVTLTLMGGNSFDTSTSLWLQVGAFRQICTNGAVIGKVLAYLRKRHVQSLALGQMVANVSDAKEQFVEAVAKWREYAATPFSYWQASKMLDAVKEAGRTALTDNQITAILREFDVPRHGQRDETLWGFYNAITSVASHEARGTSPTFELLRSANTLAAEGEIYVRTPIRVAA